MKNQTINKESGNRGGTVYLAAGAGLALLSVLALQGSSSAGTAATTTPIELFEDEQTIEDVIDRELDPITQLDPSTTRLLYEGSDGRAWSGISHKYGTCLISEVTLSSGDWAVGVACEHERFATDGVALEVEVRGHARDALLVSDEVDALLAVEVDEVSAVERLGSNLYALKEPSGAVREIHLDNGDAVSIGIGFG